MSELVQLTLEGRPFEPNEVKPYRWITLAEQKEFVTFLEELGGISKDFVFDGKLSWCASEYEKYKCANDADHSRVTKYLACGKRGTCARCSMSYAHKRAGIMYQWLKENLAKRLMSFDLKMNQIVLTLPKQLHDMDKKIFVKMVKTFLKKQGIEAYGYCIQDRHSSNPLSEKYLHAHILTLNIKEIDCSIVKSEYYFDVGRLRSHWKQIILEHTNIEIEGDVNLHNEYHSVLYSPEIIKHWLAYLYRYPIQDLFQVQVRDKSINYVQTQQIENFEGPNNILQLEISKKIYDMTREPKPRIVWCGLLASGSRKRLLKLLQVDSEQWKSLVDVEKELDLRAKTCRDCGCQLEGQPYERGKYEGDNEPLLLNQFHGLGR